MKILALTSDRPRHRALLAKLAELGQVVAFQEVAAPKRSPVQEHYFSLVRAAEQKVFGDPQPRLSARVVLPMGTLSASDNPLLNAAYDRVVVFGASWIRSPLIDRLEGAINLHAGTSPEYRGTASNFWAEWDGRPDLVGATAHLLARGLDDGPIYARVPAPHEPDPFVRGMLAIEQGIATVASLVPSQRVQVFPQDSTRLIRYSRAADFTDEICASYLERL